MGTMRHGMGGMGGSRAERSPRAGGARGGTDLPKKKPDLKKLWPQIWSLDTFTKLAITDGAMIVVALAWHFVAAERRASERLSRDKRLD